MALLVGKAHDLVLYGRAVARAGAAYQPRIARRQRDVVAYQLVRLRRRVGQVAHRAVLQFALGHERERRYRIVAGLRYHLAEVYRAHIDARGRAGLEPPQFKAEFGQRVAQRPRREQSLWSGLPCRLADYYAALQVHAGAHYRRPAAVPRAGQRDDRLDLAAPCVYARALALAHSQMLLVFERGAHPALIGALVGLRAQRQHRRALGRVEHARLNERIVYRAAHLAAQRVYLAHKVALGRAAYRRIARHQRDRVEVERQHQRLKPQPRTRQRGFHTGMARAYHHHIVHSGFKFHISIHAFL